MTDDLRKIGRDGHPSHRLYRTQEKVESRNLSLCIHTHLNPSQFHETVLRISSMTEFNVMDICITTDNIFYDQRHLIRQYIRFSIDLVGTLDYQSVGYQINVALGVFL